MFKKVSLIITLLVLGLASCTSDNNENNEIAENLAPPTILSVMTHDSFAISEDVLAEFESENNVHVMFLRAGDTGTAVNKAALAGDAPLADVFYGVDNTFLSRAIEENIFEVYRSPLLDDIPDAFKLDDEFRALPVDYGDVCLNYDIEYFAENKLLIPNKLKDLLIPKYSGLLVVQNPATSSPGLAFLFATIGEFGTDGYLEFWEGLVKNDVLVVNDWETAYYSEFSRWGGTRPMVVSYGSSPSFEVIFSEEDIDEVPTGAVVANGTCFRQIEFVGILRGTANREMAEKWVDFMLSPAFQEDMPLQMYVFPVNENAKIDAAFIEYLAEPEVPIFLAPEDIATHREEWIEAWTNVVIR